MSETQTSEPIDWEDYSIYHQGIPTDWVNVLDLNGGDPYAWTTLRAFWSPTARRYFWSGDSGCSCSYWGQDLNSPSDFEDGDRAALRKAIRDFAEGHSYSISGADAIDAVDKLARFSEVIA